MSQFFPPNINQILPPQAGNSGKFLTTDGKVASWGTGAGSGVSSLNSLTGALSLVAGTNITITPSGSNITIDATAGGGGNSFPFTIVQQGIVSYDSATTSYTLTFQNTATSGNTLIALCAYTTFGGATFTPPSGYTTIATATQASGAGVGAYMKTSTGTETNFTASSSSSDLAAFAFLELQGSRTVDKTASSTATTTDLISFPTLTSPASNSGVFCIASPSSSADPAAYGFIANNWSPFYTTTKYHAIVCFILSQKASVGIPYPQITVPSTNNTHAMISFSLT